MEIKVSLKTKFLLVNSMIRNDSAAFKFSLNNELYPKYLISCILQPGFIWRVHNLNEGLPIKKDTYCPVSHPMLTDSPQQTLESSL